jgi:hypothetical protein
MLKYCVNIIESERGWGQRVDEQKIFDTESEALEYAANYNKTNNAKTVPDWYMYAQKPFKADVKSDDVWLQEIHQAPNGLKQSNTN